MAHAGPGADAVPPAPPAPLVVPAAAAPTSYREVFADSTRDAVFGRPAEYLADYRFVNVGGQAVPTPAVLRDQTVFLCDRQPMAFLCLVARLDDVMEVRILLRLVMQYLDVLRTK